MLLDWPVRARSLGLLTVGAVITAIGLNGFVIPNKLAEGGITGISILLHYYTGLPVGVIYFAVNVPLLAMGWRVFGRDFALHTLAGSALLSAALVLTRRLAFPMPQDLLLASIYGGTVIGLGIGLMFRSGGSSGGLDIVAKYLKDRFGISVGETFLTADIVILGLIGLSLGANTALYALIITFLVGRVVDAVQEGPNRAKAAIVISNKPDEVAGLILHRFNRGATILHGQGGFTGEDKRVVLVVLSRRELVQLKDAVRSLDPAAFIIIADIAEVLGEGFGAAL